MHTQYSFAVVLLSCITAVASQSLPSLYDALVAAGASNFAAFLQENTNTSDLYGSGNGVTIFAPSDWATGFSSLTRRDTEATAQAQYQIIDGITSTQSSSSGSTSGIKLPTVLKAPGLADNTQKAVTDPRPANTTTLSRRYALDTRAAYRRSTNVTSLLRIDTGLGAVSNVIKGDISYDGGLIQIIDSYFTLPLSLSSTTSQTGLTTFNTLVNKANLTSTLENTQSIIAFLPSNAAFSAAGNSTMSTSTLISNHVVGGFSGYLPDLTDGMNLTTNTGGILKVSIRDGIWYINNAKITQANMILENGVAHVIDQVLTPTTPTVVTSSGHQTVGPGLSSLLFGPLAMLALLF